MGVSHRGDVTVWAQLLQQAMLLSVLCARTFVPCHALSTETIRHCCEP